MLIRLAALGFPLVVIAGRLAVNGASKVGLRRRRLPTPRAGSIEHAEKG
jgi:hypothetical protein